MSTGISRSERFRSIKIREIMRGEKLTDVTDTTGKKQ
jgi:hypothetical protein